MIKRISTIEELSGLALAWEKLTADRAVRVFQTYQWCCEAWMNCLLKDGFRLYVLVWEQEKREDKVIFPFVQDACGDVRFMMDEHSDACDCVYAPGENHHLAFKEALEYIQADPTVRFLALNKMDGDSEALNYFGTLGRKPKITCENAESWIQVTGEADFAASQAQLRSKDKANIRAIKRKADKYRLVVSSHAKGDAYPEADIDFIVREMVRANRREAAFMPDSLRAFCRQIYELEMTDIVELKDEGGKPVALNFILRMEGRRLSWIFLYTDPHASTELYVKYFYETADGQPYVFDFGTGGYDYKLGTFRPCMRTVYSLRIAMSRRAKIQARLTGVKWGIKDLAALSLELLGLKK